MAKFAAKDSNKNITLSPHGTGKVVVGTGAADATVQSDGNHNLVLQTGNSTTGSISINDGANGNIAITPDGTGEVDISKVDIDSGAIDAVTLGTNSAVTEAQIDNININGNAIISSNTDGNIDLTPNGTGEVNISKVDIDSGTIDGTTIATSDVTVGSGKTLDVSAGTLTTSTAQKQTISATAFASGTKMIFQQTAAPTGWTKVTSSNDVALRVVSGTVGSGGSVAFETAFASHTPSQSSSASVSSHTLAANELPAHFHDIHVDSSLPSHTGGAIVAGPGAATNAKTTLSSGNMGGAGHTHGMTQATYSAINLDVSFVDVIIATKD